MTREAELTRLTIRTAASMASLVPHLEISLRANGDALRQRISLRIVPPRRTTMLISAAEIRDLLAVLAVMDSRGRDGGGG